jgi:predicted MarR family transcription regulator
MTTQSKRPSAGRQPDEISAARALLHHSHLSPSAAEDAFTEFEFALHHITEAFARWSAALHEYVSGESLPVQDISLLQLIRMNERPKSAAEIGKFLNRDDSSNILYSLRKLEKLGLIEKTGGALRQTAYQVTHRWREVTDAYADMRRRILLESVDKLAAPGDDLLVVTRTIWRISGLYEQAARTTAMTTMLHPDSRIESKVSVSKRRPKRRPKALTTE